MKKNKKSNNQFHRHDTPRVYRFFFRVSKEEKDFIEKKAELAGCKTISEYLRRTAVNSHIINYTGDDISGILKDVLLTYNNINQLVRCSQNSGSACADDINYITRRLDWICGILQSIAEFLNVINP